MKRYAVSTLVLSLIAAVGTVSAQSAAPQSTALPTAVSGQQINGSGAYYDYARVLRVDPVLVSRRDASAEECEDDNSYASQSDRRYDDRTYDDRYDNRRYDDRRYDDRYDDRRYDRDGYVRRDDGYGTGTGRTVATMIGGVVGAVLGSKVGGGSGRYVTSSVGSMVGGMAGREIYENVQRSKQPPRRTSVTVCGPYRDGDQYASAGSTSVTAYDVTYEYAGRQHVTRTNAHPGDRIRIRVDVTPE